MKHLLLQLRVFVRTSNDALLEENESRSFCFKPQFVFLAYFSASLATLAIQKSLARIEVPVIGVHHALRVILAWRFMGLDCILRGPISR